MEELKISQPDQKTIPNMAVYPNCKPSEEVRQSIIDWMLAGILTAAAILGAFFTVFPAFFPKIAEDLGFSKNVIGLAYSIKYVTVFLGSIMGEWLIRKIGRKALVILGVVLQIVTGVMLAAITSLDDTGFITVTFIARLIQGIAGGYIQVGEYAIMYL